MLISREYITFCGLLILSNSSFAQRKEKQRLEKVEKKNSNYRKYEKKGSIRKYRLPEKAFKVSVYSIEEWKDLGLSNKQAEIVVEYCRKGVYSIDQMEKIYVFPDELLTLITDSLIFDVHKEQQKEFTTKAKLEINEATEAELLSITGIGDFYAKEIIKLRKRFGGFVSIEQLKSLKYMDDEKLSKLIPQFKIDDSKVEKLNINLSNSKTLAEHPWIDFKVANSIEKMRNQKGGLFASLEELKESFLIDAELFEKLKPYLSL